MSRAAPPLRFLGAVLGGWVCLRVAILTPSWRPASAGPEAPPQPRAVDRPARVRFGTIAPPSERPAAPLSVAGIPPSLSRSPGLRPAAAEPPFSLAPPRAAAAPAPQPVAPRPSPDLARAGADPLPLLATLPVSAPQAGRWQGLAWVLVRQGRGSGALGGSQAGGRLL